VETIWDCGYAGPVLDFREPRFASQDNLVSVLRRSAFVGIAAVGITIAIIAGTFDLSVGSIQALSAWTAYDTLVISDNEKGGVTAADHINLVLKGRASSSRKVASISCEPSAIYATRRNAGFEKWI
jgi:ribose/xylose/arabinose/galactoside ABC-type transport system permease subunit